MLQTINNYNKACVKGHVVVVVCSLIMCLYTLKAYRYCKQYRPRSDCRSDCHLSKRQKIGNQDLLSLNACQKYCRMPLGEHSAILLSFIELPFVTEIFVLSVFEWQFYTGLTVCEECESATVRQKTVEPVSVCESSKFQKS